MQNINVAKNSGRYKFIESILGAPHMTVFKEGKTVALWYVEDADKKVVDEMVSEMEKESEAVQS